MTNPPFTPPPARPAHLQRLPATLAFGAHFPVTNDLHDRMIDLAARAVDPVVLRRIEGDPRTLAAAALAARNRLTDPEADVVDAAWNGAGGAPFRHVYADSDDTAVVTAAAAAIMTLHHLASLTVDAQTLAPILAAVLTAYAPQVARP